MSINPTEDEVNAYIDFLEREAIRESFEPHFAAIGLNRQITRYHFGAGEPRGAADGGYLRALAQQAIADYNRPSKRFWRWLRGKMH